jgi:hypothetical protein
MLVSRTLPVTLVLALLVTVPARAAVWTPRDYADLNTLQIRTTGAAEGKHWSRLWLVVIDDQVYVRLGKRAAERVEHNLTVPWVGVRLAGQHFEHVRAVRAPEYAQRVANAMADKYWLDFIVRRMEHPMTLRLVPDTGE